MADLPSIHVALNNVKRAVGGVGKNERNQMQNFNFRGIDAVVNACAGPLNEQGVITVPEVLDFTYETVEVGAKRTQMGHVTLRAMYHFFGPTGDKVTATVVSESMDSGDKAMAKAMSVAYRIALLQVLNLPTNDPDPDSVSYERSEATPKNSETRNVAHSGPKAELAVSQDIATLVKNAENAKTVDQLRNAWKDAGVAGALQTKISVSGKQVVFQDFLLNKHDDLTEAAAKKNLADAGLTKA